MGNCFTEQDYEEDRYRKAYYREDQQRRDSRHFSQQQSGGPWGDEEPPRHQYIDEREYMDQKYRRNDNRHHFDPYAPVPRSRHSRPQADGWDRDHGGPSDHMDRFSNHDGDLMSDQGRPQPSIGGGDLSGSVHGGRKSKSSRHRYQPNDFEVRSNRGGAMDYRESRSQAREPKRRDGGYGEDIDEETGRHPLYPFEQVRTSHPAPQHDMPRKKSLQERISHYRQRKLTEERSMGHYNSEHEYREILRSSERQNEEEEDQSFDYATNGRKKSLQQRVEEFKNRRKHSQVRFEDESESQAEARNNQHRPETMRNSRVYDEERQSRPRRGTRGTRGGNEDARGPSQRRGSEDMGQPPRKNSRASKSERNGGRKSLNKNSRERSGDGAPSSSRSNRRKNSMSRNTNDRGRSTERRKESLRRTSTRKSKKQRKTHQNENMSSHQENPEKVKRKSSIRRAHGDKSKHNPKDPENPRPRQLRRESPPSVVIEETPDNTTIASPTETASTIFETTEITETNTPQDLTTPTMAQPEPSKHQLEPLSNSKNKKKRENKQTNSSSYELYNDKFYKNDESPSYRPPSNEREKAFSTSSHISNDTMISFKSDQFTIDEFTETSTKHQNFDESLQFTDDRNPKHPESNYSLASSQYTDYQYSGHSNQYSLASTAQFTEDNPQPRNVHHPHGNFSINSAQCTQNPNHQYSEQFTEDHYSAQFEDRAHRPNNYSSSTLNTENTFYSPPRNFDQRGNNFSTSTGQFIDDSNYSQDSRHFDSLSSAKYNPPQRNQYHQNSNYSINSYQFAEDDPRYAHSITTSVPYTDTESQHLRPANHYRDYTNDTIPTDQHKNNYSLSSGQFADYTQENNHTNNYSLSSGQFTDYTVTTTASIPNHQNQRYSDEYSDHRPRFTPSPNHEHSPNSVMNHLSNSQLLDQLRSSQSPDHSSYHHYPLGNKPPRKQSNTNSQRSSRSKANNNGEDISKLDLKERIARRSRREQPQEFVLHE